MSKTYTASAKLEKREALDRGWNLTINRNSNTLDAINAIGDMAVTTSQVPSSSLNVDVAAGIFAKSDGTIGTFAGAGAQATAPSTTNYVYLSSAGTLVINTTGFPASGTYYPLAVVVSGTSTVTSIADHRPSLVPVGVFLPVGGGTLEDGANVALGTTTGTKIGTAATQKLGFYGATPVVQPSGSAQAALTDSTGGTASTTISNVGGSFSQSTLNNNFASLVNLANALRSAGVSAGLWKGGA